MSDQKKDEPLEGFHITGYDDKSENVEISLHRLILTNANQKEALANEAIEIMTSGPNVKRVTFVLRDD